MRGVVIGKGKEHPDFALLEKYLEKLENWLKRAQQIWPEDPREALFWDGYAAWEKGTQAEAQSKWEEVLTRQPSHSFAVNMLHKLCEEMKDG